MNMNSLDYCPVCNMLIADGDPGGCETLPLGQRYCLVHLPISAYWEDEAIHVD